MFVLKLSSIQITITYISYSIQRHRHANLYTKTGDDLINKEKYFLNYFLGNIYLSILLVLSGENLKLSDRYPFIKCSRKLWDCFCLSASVQCIHQDVLNPNGIEPTFLKLDSWSPGAGFIPIITSNVLN